MSFNLGSYGRALLVGGFVGALFMACAEGTTAPFGNSSGGSGGSPVGIPPGQIGGLCVDDNSCVDEGASCIKVGSETYCTVPCPPGCPQGTYCAIISGESMCVPDLDSQCLPCTTVLQCLNPSDSCLTAPSGDKFCARDCTTTGECPNGFTCVEGANYPPKEKPEMPVTDGGTDGGTGGGSDGGTDGGADGGDAGPMMPPAGQPYKFCVPNPPFSCPCTPKRDGVEKPCSIENEYGTCVGVEICSGDMNKFGACTAQTPEPDMPLSSGCTCPPDANETNDLCANATSAGMVTDTAGSSLTLTGVLSSPNDVDVWTFDTVDNDEGTTNSYHLSINFTAPMPNDEFVIDVIHGDACTDKPTGNSTNITSYTWCVDGKSADGTRGEAPCANDDSQTVHCGNHSSKYFVIVRRKPAAMGTCTPYNIQVTAFGGGPCDFTIENCE